MLRGCQRLLRRSLANAALDALVVWSEAVSTIRAIDQLRMLSLSKGITHRLERCWLSWRCKHANESSSVMIRAAAKAHSEDEASVACCPDVAVDGTW